MEEKLLILLLCVFTFSCHSPQQKQDGPKAEGEPEIHFQQFTWDFGTIKQGEKVAHIFTFENRGKGPLVITSASSTCGCTIPEFSDKPVDPGEKGQLEVVFDSSGRSGKQTKTVRVYTNTKKKMVMLSIAANVETN